MTSLYVEAVRLAVAASYPEAITIEEPCARMEIGERLGYYAARRSAQVGLFGEGA